MGEQLPDDNDKSEQSPDVTVKATQTIGKQSGGEANAVKFDRARDVQIHYHGKEAAEKPPLPYEPETVLIPAGPFLMGDDDNPITAPKHTVELPAFRIGCYPVTNEQFAHFLWKTNRGAPKELLWDGNQPPIGQENYPVAGVTWYEALAYCEWLSESEETGRLYTLPNEAQWEKAARGTDGRAFPWGDEWDPDRCNADREALAAVDAFPPQSPFDCYDMVGNVREWTATLWGTSPRAPDPLFCYPWAADGRNELSAPDTTWRVFRGGRARRPAGFLCSARRGHPPADRGPKQNRIGFRVVCLIGG